MYIEPELHFELAEVAWALDKNIGEIIREMVHNDLPKFKNRHRQAIREGKQSRQ